MTRIERETRTVRLMIGLYCRRHHPAREKDAMGLCDECAELAIYAAMRLSLCPFGDSKGACQHCTIHCYRPDMRLRIRRVMRFAGPRMLLHHPIAALRHLLRF